MVFVGFKQFNECLANACSQCLSASHHVSLKWVGSSSPNSVVALKKIPVIGKKKKKFMTASVFQPCFMWQLQATVVMYVYEGNGHA